MIKVSNIMTKGVITVTPDSGIKKAAGLIASKSVSSLVILDMENPVAVITENDIIRGIISKKSKVRDVMNKEFIIISPQTKFSEITKVLREGKIKRFPVMEDGKLVGLVTETDIIQATRDFTRFHQIVQEVILAVFGLATAFFLFYFSPIGVSILR
ncbi:CBS domain-containing protein [Candidatus Woesearchaeota archaeon]|nr:CBS domain-containing protein [Candidatus Woesearchaeota archaeon]